MTQSVVSRRVIGEGIGTTVGVVINAGVAFVVAWLVSRGLGAEGAGYFFLLTSVFVITTSAIGMGADTGLMRMLSRHRALGDRHEYRVTVAVGLAPVVVVGTVTAGVILLNAEGVTAALGLDAALIGVVRLLAGFLLPATIAGVMLGGCRGLGHVHAYTAVQNLTVPILRACAVGGGLLVAPAVGAVVGLWVAPLGLAAVVAALLLRHYVRRDAPRRQPVPPLGAAHLRHVALTFWRFTLPRGLAVLVERGIDWADVLLVIYLLGPAAGGVYGVVSRCAMAGHFLESAMRIVAGPRISAAVAMEDQARVSRIFDLVTRVLVIALWPFYILLALFSGRVLALFGEEFTAGAPALSIVCLAMMCSSAAGMLQTFLLMAGRSHWQLMNRTCQLGVLVALAWLLVPRLGLVGAALAWAAGILVDTTMAAVQVSGLLGARTRLRNVALAMGVPLVVVGTGGLLVRAATGEHPLLVVAACLVAVCVLYLAAVYAFRERLGLPRSLRRKV